jgi:hypothetical protein
VISCSFYLFSPSFGPIGWGINHTPAGVRGIGFHHRMKSIACKPEISLSYRLGIGFLTEHL